MYGVRVENGSETVERGRVLEKRMIVLQLKNNLLEPRYLICH